MLGERLHIRVKASEQEAAIGFEPRDLLQIVRAFDVELLGIAGPVRIFHLQQLAGIAEGPTVKWAGKSRLATALVTANHRTTMTAGIDEGIDLVILVAGDDDGLPSHPCREIIILVRNLALVRKEDPVALEEVLHLQLEQLGVSKYCTVTAIESVGRILYQCFVEASNDAGRHGLSPHAPSRVASLARQSKI